MKTLRDRLARYTGVLREFKASYVLYNVLNRDKLQRNKALYRKYGIKKSILSPIGHKDMPDHPLDKPWLDQENALEQVVQHPDYSNLSDEQQAAVKHFIQHGYLVLKGFFKEEAIDQLNAEMDNMLKEQELKFNYSGRKILDAFRYSKVADEAFFRNQELLRLLNFILGKKVIPFQTLNFIKGSEQSAHSDSIHMCTHPFGYLIASWIALEDIQEGTGELFYYPGSHRLPFVSAEDYDSGNSYWRIGKESNRKYEEKMQKVVADNNFPKAVFLAEKGDLLLWHANLIHGGSPITKPESTRRSMVAHYYCEDVICYHEMTQRPALV